MKLDADVEVVAKYFGIDPALLQAVVNAEGNIFRAVQCSQPHVKDRRDALNITARSCVHALMDWLKKGGDAQCDSFVAFWANRWAPIGATNDPHHLNANWTANVERLWRSPLENRT